MINDLAGVGKTVW